MKRIIDFKKDKPYLIIIGFLLIILIYGFVSSPDTALHVWKYYKYLSDLVDRFNENGNEVNHVCVSSGKLRDTKNFIKNHNITLDVIIDNGSNLNKLFKLEGNNGVVIVKNGKVDFHYRKSNIDPMLTRQLFEKYFKRGVN